MVLASVPQEPQKTEKNANEIGGSDERRESNEVG